MLNSIFDMLRQPGIIQLLGFALGLYVATSSIKFIASKIGGKTKDVVDGYVSIIPVLLGMLTAPFVVPYLMSEFGAKVENIPLAANVFTGMTAGGISKVLWDVINKIIKQRILGLYDGPRQENHNESHRL